MVFQNYALYPHMTVFENMAFPLKVAHMPNSEIARIVEATARLLELDQLLDRRPSQLSGGQRQRVALGRGLVRQPSIFLLDEPLSNLDAALRQKMRQEIVALQKRLGITMIYVTHDQIEALTMADRMVVLKDGRIRQSGTPAELYRDPHDSFVASFIGAPSINLFDEEITGGIGRRLPVHYGTLAPDGTYTVGIRPEHIVCDPQGGVTGEITAVEYIGPVSYLRVCVGEITLVMTVESAAVICEVGRPVKITVDPGRVYLFDRTEGRRIGKMPSEKQ
jgi:ABC-type sugar transport system ATPase subunit